MRPVYNVCLALAISAGASSALGQNTVSVLSTFAKLGKPIPAICLQQVEVFKTIAKNYPLPASWKFLIACDDVQWGLFLRHEGITLDGRTHYAETDIQGGMTVLRGETLLYPDAPGAMPDHVIAHELAHIALHGEDEAKVESITQEWLAMSRHRAERPPNNTACETALRNAAAIALPLAMQHPGCSLSPIGRTSRP